ncbi:MAG TPA: aminotransferase class IV, partial [Burkholderiales bacterium]|nr:aminotransferase class IV [Burkholderiales bacterium]
MPFRVGGHLERLQASLDSIRLDNPHTESEWRQLLASLIERNEPEDQSLYLQITRGVAKRDHAFPENTIPTVFIMSNPLLPPTSDQIENGVSAITAPDNRWSRCDVKSTALLPNVLLRQLAVDAGCTETLLLRDG